MGAVSPVPTFLARMSDLGIALPFALEAGEHMPSHALGFVNSIRHGTAALCHGLFRRESELAPVDVSVVRGQAENIKGATTARLSRRFKLRREVFKLQVCGRVPHRWRSEDVPLARIGASRRRLDANQKRVRLAQQPFEAQGKAAPLSRGKAA
jgi:hypothetical protein